MPVENDPLRRVEVAFQHFQGVQRGTDHESACVRSCLRMKEEKRRLRDHHVKCRLILSDALEHAYWIMEKCMLVQQEGRVIQSLMS